MKRGWNGDEVKRVLLALTTGVLLAGCGGAQPAVKYGADGKSRMPFKPLLWTFDADSVGAPPPGSTVFSGTWLVRAEPDAPSAPNAVCQTGTADFPALELGETVFTDFAFQARFKPISGRTDQAGGLIFRIQGKDDYYILRANALEGNVNFYKYAGGRRSSLAEGKAKVEAGKWQELRVAVSGSRFRGLLDGKQVVDVTDDSYQAGRVGLWTKADSVTCFDDVEVKAP